MNAEIAFICEFKFSLIPINEPILFKSLKVLIPVEEKISFTA